MVFPLFLETLISTHVVYRWCLLAKRCQAQEVGSYKEATVQVEQVGWNPPGRPWGPAGFFFGVWKNASGDMFTKSV